MGKTIVAAFLAGVVASVLVVLLMRSIEGDEAVRAAETERDALRAELDRMGERVNTALERGDRIETQLRTVEKTATTASSRADSALAATGTEIASDAADAPLQSPDGTAYVSRAEMEAALQEMRDAGWAGTEIEFQEPRTVQEIAAEMGLTAQQEASVVVAVRDTEQELVNILFGKRSIESVKEDLQRAADDPDFKSELIQRTITRAVGNIGKLATMEDRLRAKVVDILGEEQADEFLANPRVPVLDPKLDEFFDDTF